MGRNRRRKLQSLPPVELTIDNLSHEGRGIARLDGKVVFVEQALPGERVLARLTGKRDSYNEAELLEVYEASPDRIEPHCSYASICGGCSLQHFDPDAQIRFKEGVLHEKLSHSLGRDDYRHLSVIKGPVGGYRRKARLAVRYVHKKEKVLVGFREKKSGFITDMESCQVLEPGVSNLLPLLSGLIGGLDGFRDIPQLEVAVGDADSDSCEIALVVRHLRPLSENDLISWKDFARQQGIAIYLQPGGLDTVHKLYPAAGEDRLYYDLPDFNLRLWFHPQDFTQVNAEINRNMLSRAVELLEVESGDRVLDLFCGLGNFTLALARICHSVTGVEGVREMVDRGYENARRNEVHNATFMHADLGTPSGQFAWLDEPYTKVLLDPPRSGALEILPRLMTCGASAILYISCNPSTLARDASILEAGGYRLSSAGVLDMFPQTTHVESMALFERGR